LALFASRPSAHIVRLHSGDPSLYGAIQEQIDWCHANHRDFELVPGVSSLGAAAAAIGRELTIPQVSQSVVLTRLAGRTAASMPTTESVSEFARHGATMAVFLSAARPAELQASLLADGEGYAPATPAAVVIRASWPEERIVRTTVGDLAVALEASGATMTALVIVGPVVGATDDDPVARSHLYSPTFTHAYRKRSLPGTTLGRPSVRAERVEP
ncbi:MAG TPA: cobalt-precorrin-4/precorrin-4 C(11)-methyltransferase, partial [Acidimicrobiales bacterium]|nr:cobalt-precorrin-4/precorrin-4 C(11)-methyltransferase [Acidimicrobiales bacterium]